MTRYYVTYRLRGDKDSLLRAGPYDTKLDAWYHLWDIGDYSHVILAAIQEEEVPSGPPPSPFDPQPLLD